ncbi:MDR family MFS transporter [Paenisporosarcina cavernae]|uniref:MFS transporter n=1 Tax=Paenisporosarcina cavernae TaxID=2320858 RepID=A0A385YUA5_9BACL|nr:MFS transporter [Paenisporosarcina cavernae]AYC30134.1 MFS transporter [Paenisporosarcina cavernae]
MKIKDWDKSLKVRLFGEALINITFWMFFPFLAIYFAEELGRATAGALLIISQVFSVIANLVGGYAADTFGRKRMMVVASIGQSLAMVLFAFANSPVYESAILGFVAFTIASVFGSFYWPASQAMVADVVPEEHRSDVFAVFYTSINIAVVIGPILGGIFFFTYRFELLLVAAAFSLLLGWILYKFTTESLPASADKLPTDTSRGAMHAIKTQVKDYGVILQDKVFLLFIVAGVLSAQTFMQMDLLLPVFIKDVMPETVVSILDWDFNLTGELAFSMIISENGFLVALLTVAITRFVVRYSERNVFIVSSILYAVGMLVFAMFNMFFMFIIAMFIFTLGELLVVGIQQSFISKLAPEHMRGQYFAAASLRYTIGRTIAPISIPLTVWIGYNWTFGLIIVLQLLAALTYYWMFHLFAQKKAASTL